MPIHQAIYGPNKGHALLKVSSNSVEDVFKSAAWLTDLPSTAPNGISWKPYFKLALFNEYLLFVYTRPATHVAREGMVVSRSALIPRAEIDSLPDLRPLAAVIQADYDDSIPLNAINLHELNSVHAPEEVSDLTTRIASAIMSSNIKPLVVVGQEGFDEAMFELWARVPVEFRQSLSFGVSFGPDESGALSIVSTPAELANRWLTTQIVNRTNAVENCFPSATLLNFPKVDSIRSFAKEASLSLNSSISIKIAVNAYQDVSESSGADGAVRLLRVLVERSGASESSRDFKVRVTKRLTDKIRQSNVITIRSMRNLELSGISGGEALAKELSAWIENPRSDVSATDIMDVIHAWALKKSEKFWQSAIEAGLKSAFKKPMVNQKLLQAIWDGLLSYPELGDEFLSLIPSTQESEKNLLISKPKLVSFAFAEKILPNLIAKKWWELVATLLYDTRNLTIACQAAIAVSSEKVRRTLLQSILAHAKAADAVQAAISCGDAQALTVAADISVKSPEVFQEFDWTNSHWFSIFDKAQQQLPSIYEHLQEPTVGMELVINSGCTQVSIWDVVARTQLADLSGINNRQNAWPLIPPQFIQKIAEVTAENWLLRFESNEVAYPPEDRVLLERVDSIVNAKGYLLTVVRRNPHALERYFQTFGIANEDSACDFIYSVARQDSSLPRSAAQSLGEIINRSHWKIAAEKIANHLYQRNDFNPLMMPCRDLLPFSSRLWVFIRLKVALHLDDDEAWNAFEQEARERYSSGPRHHELWSRSGGHDEDLDTEGNGGTQWHRCVKQLRAGKRPGVHALLNVMESDYGMSDVIKQLKLQNFSS